MNNDSRHQRREFAADIHLGCLLPTTGHMVLDKFQVRTHRSRCPVTRQLEKVITGALFVAFGVLIACFKGRNGGEYSIGEMERDASLRTALASYFKIGC